MGAITQDVHWNAIFCAYIFLWLVYDGQTE